MKRSCLLAMLWLLSGCGDDASETVAPPQPPQAPADCEEHELSLPDGTCIRPGVPPDGCSDGFEHDGVYGCEPILPAEPCPAGLMAVPGDSACRPVMDCGAGQWGDLPVDATTQYVDVAYTGGSNSGSQAAPWTTVQQAVDAAAPGALIAVAAGSYIENVIIAAKSVRLWGVCPAQVELVAGTQATGVCEDAALCLHSGSHDTEVGGLAVRGTTLGLAVFTSLDVVVDRVRIHNNAGRGISLRDSLGPTSMHVSGSLIEQNHDYGIYVSGAQATVDASVVRGTMPRTSDQLRGRGISVRRNCVDRPTGLECAPERASLSVRRSLIEQNHEHGIYISGSEATVEASVVRGTLPRASDLTSGSGIKANVSCLSTDSGEQCIPESRSNLELHGSLVEDNHTVGVFVLGSDATVETSVVRNTRPRAADQSAGHGVNVQFACLELTSRTMCTISAAADIRGSLIEGNHEVGLNVHGAAATIDTTVVRTTAPRASDQRAGRGVNVQLACIGASSAQCETALRASASIHGTLIEQSHEFGLSIAGSDASVESSVVRATSPRMVDALFGDGVSVASLASMASATVTNTLIADSARAGLSSFGALVSLAESRVGCAAFQLNGEPFDGHDTEFFDGGGNLCGCPDPGEACKLISAGLAPPEPLGSGQ